MKSKNEKFDLELPRPKVPLHAWSKEGLIAVVQEIEAWRSLPAGQDAIQLKLKSYEKQGKRRVFAL